MLFDFLDDRLQFPRHGSAVGIAKYNAICMALFRSTECLNSIFRICLVTIKEMFRIVNHLFGMFLEVGHRRLDHVQILFQRGADNVGHMQVPALAENRLDRGARLYKGLQQRVLFGVVCQHEEGHAEEENM